MIGIKESCNDCYDVTDASAWCDKATRETEFYKPPQNLVNPPCIWCTTDYREFEKSVKSYDLSNGFLTIGRRDIDTDMIDYLEIDGRVVIDEGGEEDERTHE